MDVGSRHRVELLIVHEGDEEWRTPRALNSFKIRELWIPRPGKFFNKPVLQNAGIDAAEGEVLTFLDADALVGPFFFDAASLAATPRLTKVCYRVRLLPPTALDDLEAVDGNAHATIDAWFDKWDSYTPAVEAYGSPTDFVSKGGDPVYGNSQFSISRQQLGALRFDERFESAGYEDLWMNREIAFQHGAGYRALMITDPDHAMFHIRNEREPDWCEPVANLMNTLLYEKERERKGG